MPLWLQILLPFLTTLFGAATAYFFTSRANKRKIAEANREKRLKFYQSMSQHLHASRDGFIEQCKIRNRLLASLGHDPDTFDWEKLEETFSNAYPKLTDDQRKDFEFIRGITKTALLPRNRDMLELLQENPDYYRELPGFKELLGHLGLWLAKYGSHLEKRPDYCLIYVGLKDKKPFPKNILKKVEHILSEIQESAD